MQKGKTPGIKLILLLVEAFQVLKFEVLLIYCYFYYFFSFLTVCEMEIDYISPRSIFSSKKLAYAKISTEWKTDFIPKNLVMKCRIKHCKN